MNIVLVGFMGSGKSAIGKAISKKTRMQFIDTDALIEKHAGLSIPDIFSKNGEKGFRELEKKAISEVSKKDNCVISTGGGVVLDKENILNLKRNGKIFYLKISPENCFSRVKKSENRPLLQVEDKLSEIRKLMSFREPFYLSSSDYLINSDSSSKAKIVSEIVSVIGNKRDKSLQRTSESAKPLPSRNIPAESFPRPKEAVKPHLSSEPPLTLNESADANKTFAVIGDPIAHTLSPAMHNAAFLEMKLYGYSYVALHVTKERLSAVVRQLRSSFFGGFNVTIPHKSAVMPYLDEIDSLAKKIGAVNTVLNENGRLKGYNTDAYGALSAIEKICPVPKGKKIVILGAGGAARAAAFSLSSENEIVLLDADEEKAKQVAKELGGKAKVEKMSEETLAKHLATADLLINATPVGMHPNVSASPVPKSLLNRKTSVFDMVYIPPETRLLKDAKSAGCKAIGGSEMLLMQGAKAFEIFTGKKAPIETMRKALMDSLRLIK